MNTRVLAIVWVMVMSVPRASGQSGQTTQAPKPASKNPVVTRPQTTPPAPDVATHRAVVDQYCVICHNAKLKTANLLLDQLDLAHLGDHAEIGEKVVRKLRAGMMPPTGMPRPGPADIRRAVALESHVEVVLAGMLATAAGLAWWRR